jgi:hypothetical protein
VQNDVTLNQTSLGVFRADVPECRPIGEVLPSHFNRHQNGAIRILYDGVVDGIIR